MSIYSELSLLFRLSQELNELKEYDILEQNDIDNIKELAEKFIKSCSEILNVTLETEDETFMVKSFLNSNYDLLNWIFQNHCPEIKQNYLQNLLSNLQNEYNNDMPNNINIIKKEEIINDKDEKNEKRKENENNIKESIDTINLIKENEEKYKNDEINKKEKNIKNINYSINNNYINSNCEKETNEIEYSNTDNFNKEKKEEENDEEYDEEEEEEEDDDNISENNNEKNNNFINDNKNEENNIIKGNHIEENNENNIIDDNNNIGYIKDDDMIYNNEEEKNEDKQNINNEINEEIENIKKILEKKLNDITNKTIKEIFEIYILGKNENEKFNNIFMSLYDLKKNYNIFGQKTKEKILNLLCTIYPFCSIEQKKILYDINITDENIKIFLFKTLLNFEENNNLYKILTTIPSKKKEPLEINNNLFIHSKSELIALYQFLVIYKSFNIKGNKSEKTFDNKYEMKTFYFISFKIYFILSNVELYPFISKDILEIYEILLFIKRFYSSAFIKKIEEPYIISKIKKYKDEFKNYSLNDIKKELFDEDEKIIFNKIFENMKQFYKIDEKNGSDLLYYSDNKFLNKNNLKYNFIENIFDITYIKLNKDIKSIKNNLTRLEKNIRHITNKICRNNIKNCCSTKKELKNVYNSLISEIKKEFSKEISSDIFNKIKFYPLTLFFPFTSFNSSENELNIALDILRLKYYLRLVDIIYKLEKLLKKEYKDFKKKYDSQNIKFIFKYNEYNVSIIISGYSLYIQTIIFREYSLLDQRFPILILTLNFFLNQIGIDKEFPSFLHISLYYLLISFLQDIINPPILPKLLTQDILNIHIIPCEIELIEKKINSINNKCLHIPKIIFEKEKIKTIYNEQIKNNQNKLTCSEIFLKFLEFIIFYFKFDSVYSDLSLNYEGFNSINNILKIFDTDGNNINPNNLYFKNYFYEKYSLNKEENIILIKSDVNPFSNIGFYFKNNFKKFYEKIKKGYKILIDSGSFENLNILKDKKDKNSKK